MTILLGLETVNGIFFVSSARPLSVAVVSSRRCRRRRLLRNSSSLLVVRVSGWSVEVGSSRNDRRLDLAFSVLFLEAVPFDVGPRPTTWSSSSSSSPRSLFRGDNVPRSTDDLPFDGLCRRTFSLLLESTGNVGDDGSADGTLVSSVSIFFFPPSSWLDNDDAFFRLVFFSAFFFRSSFVWLRGLTFGLAGSGGGNMASSWLHSISKDEENVDDDVMSTVGTVEDVDGENRVTSVLLLFFFCP
jgi:hypothetical protein